MMTLPTKHKQDEKPWLRAHILYTTQETGLKAFRLFLQIERRLAGDFDLDQVLRSFDSLFFPEEAEQALREAGDADLILLAMDEDELLSPLLRRWLEDLAPVERGRQRALILLDGAADAFAEVVIKRRAWLIRLADRKGMEFFSHAQQSLEHENFHTPLLKEGVSEFGHGRKTVHAVERQCSSLQTVG